jgi:hypothetical protein
MSPRLNALIVNGPGKNSEPTSAGIGALRRIEIIPSHDPIATPDCELLLSP